MVRHIKRFHGGLGSPAKEKPSAIDSSILNNPVDSGVPSSLPGKLRPNASQVKEKDIVDMYYDWFSKIKEMQAFFGQSGSPILTLPGSFPVSFPFWTIDPPVGFHAYTCDKCLTAPIDPVRSSDFLIKGPLAFRSNHVCRQEDLDIHRRRRENGVTIEFIKVWYELNSSAIKFMADTVHRWYGPKDGVSIHVAEVDDSISQTWKLLPTYLETVPDDHWAYRALGGDKRKGTTIIDERELMYFLELGKSTFAIFRVNLRNGEKNLYAYLGPELM